MFLSINLIISNLVLPAGENSLHKIYSLMAQQVTKRVTLRRYDHLSDHLVICA